MAKRKQNNPTASQGQVRIIAGQWRSRKLHFPDSDGLRPTGDRMREMLFNWLQSDVYGARCLDVFAGSGALGLEALSRGAAQVDFCEQALFVANALKQNLALLGCNQAQVYMTDALQWLTQPNVAPYDVVFIDPPFQLALQQRCCELLQQQALLTDGAWVYVEQPVQQAALQLPENWDLAKQKSLGAVQAMLYQVTKI